MSNKIGRNDPCPCGTLRQNGLRMKYKNCCINVPYKESCRRYNEAQLHRTTKEHADFLEHFQSGFCYICKLQLGTFDEGIPCVHWLLRPQGIDKKYVAQAIDNLGLFRTEAFLRWVANTERFATNINNLSAEGDTTKIIDWTIKYQNIEWSFSCGDSDFLGHQDAVQGSKPHFHFQMRIDERPFINYSQYHFGLTSHDILAIKAIKGEIPGAVYTRTHGAGMEDIMSVVEQQDDPLQYMQSAKDEDNAQFHLQTMITAENGHTISGDRIADLIEESKRTGVPMAKLIKQLPNVKVETIISPPESIPEKASRTKRKR